MTAIPPVGTVQTAAPSPSTAPAPKQTMDSEVFLKLLVTQMSNQDPSSPMDTSQMMAQTTQLAMMEQMTAMAGTSTEQFALSMRQVAASLIGTQASYVDAAGVTQTGVVSKVTFDSGVPTVTIGDTSIPLDAVSGIAAS